MTPSQKIESMPRLSTSTPLMTRPAPPPIPNIAEIVPMPVATFSRGNSSRMIPIASGRIAPPMPWTARPDDVDAERMAERADQVARAEQQQREQQQALLAVHVAEPAEDRRRDRGGEQERRQQPGDVGRGRVQLALDRRQRRDDHRLRERVGQRAEREDEERAVRCGALLGPGAVRER